MSCSIVLFVCGTEVYVFLVDGIFLVNGHGGSFLIIYYFQWFCEYVFVFFYFVYV